MREIALLKQINESYRALNLNYSRLAIALVLMVLTSIFEMSGLSLLYPLVLTLGNSGQSLNNILSAIPLNHPVLQDNRVQIMALLSCVAILYIGKNVLLYYTYKYNIDFAMYYYRNLIKGLYKAYVQKSLLAFRENSAGSLGNIICVQSGRLVDGVIRPLLVVITEVFLLAAISLVLVLVVSPWVMAVVVLTCGGAASGYYALLRGRAMQWGKQRMYAASILQELVNNTSVGISEIKVFGKEDYLTKKVYSAALLETEMFRNWEMYNQGPRFLIETVFVVTFVLGFVLSIAVGADMSEVLAEFAVIAAASFRILPCINRLVGSYSNLSFNIGPALLLMRTITEFNLIPSGEVPRNTGERSSVFPWRVLEVKNISFEYPSLMKQILRDVNIIITSGQRVGIFGASGSGKSTLIEILAALYIPTIGCVVVDGKSITDDPRSWQASIGYVPQVPFIMPGSIRENVTFSSDGSEDDEEVWHALEKVGLSGFVSSLPDGIRAEIGEKGTGLSGGQKQLLCMARALFRKSTLLLLDEPTAALDVNSERVVLKAIHSLSRETTVVMVSHEQANFQDFDVVYVCEEGQLRIDECPYGRQVVQHSTT